MSREFKTIGVVGLGTMGAGIAEVFARNGFAVIGVEQTTEQLDRGRAHVEHSTGRALKRGKLSEAEQKAIFDRLTLTTSLGDLKDCDLVVEAVVEHLDLTRPIFQQLDDIVRPDAVLATNTSSLSETDLAAQLRRPANFVGLNFFNPVPASTLIEVVLAKETSPALATAAKAWTEALGKTAVVVNDAPGFASSRLGVAIALEAMRMVEEGVASAEDIDAAMVLGYKHPTGPLKTTDIVGLDVRLGIAEYLHSTLGERFAPPQILKDKVARGELGRKTGKGFFDWAD